MPYGAECYMEGGAAVLGEEECCASYQLSTLRTCQDPVSRNVMVWCNVSRLQHLPVAPALPHAPGRRHKPFT